MKACELTDVFTAVAIVVPYTLSTDARREKILPVKSLQFMIVISFCQFVYFCFAPIEWHLDTLKGHNSKINSPRAGSPFLAGCRPRRLT